MSALKLDVVIEQGATFQRELTVTNAETGAAFDLSGYTCGGDLKDAAGNVVAAFGTNISVNKLTIELTDEKTDLLTPTVRNTYTGTITAVSPTGQVFRLAQIKASVSAK